MNWPTDMSWFAYAPLVGSAVLLGFTPFRQNRGPASILLNAAAPVLAPCRSTEERTSAAMRNWIAERADVHPAQAEAAVVEPEPPPPDVPAPPVAPLPPIELQARVVPAQALAVPAENTVPGREIDFSAARMEVFDPERQATPNFYETLQISPRADQETIHRVYRIMAARFHPDNPISGDHPRFLELNEAYETLADPERRARYDAALQGQEPQVSPIFELRVFMAGVQGETNRRLGVLSLLYQRRRTHPTHAGLALLELETQMALPREHLEFTLWYLRSKGLAQITEERSDYALTAAGVDHIESYASRNQIVHKLLTTPGEVGTAEPSGKRRPARRRRELSCKRRLAAR